MEFGRERPGPDPGDVGLGNPDHVIDGLGSYAGAHHRAPSRGIGRGHERVSAVVDVEQSALSSFKENVFPS